MKKVGYVLLPIIIYFVAHDILQMLLYFAINWIGNGQGALAELLVKNSRILASLVQCLAMILGILFLFPYRKEINGWRPFKSVAASEQKVNPLLSGYVLIGVGAVFVAFGLNVLILNMTWAKNAAFFQETSANQNGVPIVMGLLLFCIISPFVEEYLFRGLLYGRMKSMFPIKICTMVSALFFGIYHKNMVQGIYGFLMGVILALLYETMGSLWAAVLFHAVANMTVYLGGKVVGFNEIPWFLGVLTLAIGCGIGVMFMKQQQKTDNIQKI